MLLDQCKKKKKKNLRHRFLKLLLLFVLSDRLLPMMNWLPLCPFIFSLCFQHLPKVRYGNNTSHKSTIHGPAKRAASKITWSLKKCTKRYRGITNTIQTVFWNRISRKKGGKKKNQTATLTTLDFFGGREKHELKTKHKQNPDSNQHCRSACNYSGHH